jgi:hypothetical protein
MARLRTFSFLLASSTALFATVLIAQDVVPAARIVDRVDDSRLVTLPGNTHPAARAQNDRGRVSAETPMTDLILVLSRGPEQQAAFDKFVASQYDQTSPNFHKWLEPEEVGERFGPAQGDIDTAVSWLRSHGFSVDEITKDHMSIRFSGTAAQVESAFHTEIHKLEVKGRQHIGNMTDPQIPAALAPAVMGVKALHNFFPRPLHRVGRAVTFDLESGKWKRVAPNAVAIPPVPFVPPPGALPLYGINDPNNGYLVEDVAPYDFAAIYNVLPLWSAGIDGTGQTIAIAATSDINAGQSAGTEAQSGCSPVCTGANGQKDVLTFRSAFDLPTTNAVNTPIRVSGNSQPLTICTDATGTIPYSGNPCTSDDLFENSLDVEWSGAVAKNAQIVLVASYPGSASDDNLWDSESYILANVGNAASPLNGAHIMSVSYGECELGMGASGNVAYYNLWQTAASEGVAVFVATGDSGSPGCDQGGDSQSGTPYAAEYGLSVSGMASTPFNTAVGGTDFNWGSTAPPYWSASNSSTTKSSAQGYIPEVPWNSTCTNPIIVSSINSQLKSSYSATQICDYLDTGQIYSTNSSDEQALQSLVDTVGGGGGKSGCIVSNANQDATSCGTATTVSTGNSSIPLVKDGWPKPAWQAGVTGIPADGVRDIPDVSFFASNGFLGSAYLVCDSNNGSCTYSPTSEDVYQEVGGTSASTPAMAGVMALVNQKAGSPQGNPNAGLYYLAAKQTYSSCKAESVKSSSTSCYFNDIDTGTIAMACDYSDKSPNCTGTDAVGVLTGYSAAAGYDLASGLGSLNVANVVKNWPGPIAPAVTLTPNSVTFASTVQGTAATTQTVTLKNSGNASLTGVAVSITGDSSFTQTNACAATLAASATCAITVKFTPSSVGQLSATLNIADNASGSPQKVSISGTGALAAPAVILSATTLTFASTTVGSTAAAQKITVTNSGTAALKWNSPAVSITGSSSFTQTNTCTAILAIKATCVVTVTFKPSGVGKLTATVNLADNAAGSPQTVSLSGTGSGALAGLLANSLSFPDTPVGVASAVKTATLTNSGNAALALAGTAITVTGTNATSFSQTNKCGTSLAANATCVITVTFKPTTGGKLSAAVNIAGTTGGLPLQVALTGTGLAPLASLSPTTLTFPGTPVGTSATTQQVTLNNTGTVPLTLAANAITISGTGATSYAQSNKCGTSVAAGSSCAITVTFTPKASGALTASMAIADNAAGSPQKATLSGTGTVPVAGLSPTSLTFSGTTVGTSAATKNITLSNTGGARMTLTGITISGTGATSFSQTNTCAQGVAAGSNCSITVTFSPKASGALSATVNVTDNASGSPQKVTLTGTGTTPTVSLSPTSLSFSSTAVGSSAATKTVILKNTGAGTLLLNGAGQGISMTGTNATSFSQTNNCAGTIAAGASCTITVTFKPQASGSLSAKISVADNATGSPQTAALTGTGTAPAVNLSPTSVAVSGALNTAATPQSITLKNTGTGPLTPSGAGLGISITGADASYFSQTNTCGTSLASGATCKITLHFTPNLPGTYHASLTIADNAANSPQATTLTGTGVCTTNCPPQRTVGLPK